MRKQITFALMIISGLLIGANDTTSAPKLLSGDVSTPLKLASGSGQGALVKLYRKQMLGNFRSKYVEGAGIPMLDTELNSRNKTAHTPLGFRLFLQRLDLDNDQTLSEYEFMEAVDKFISQADRDGNGVISIHELATLRDSLRDLEAIISVSEKDQKEDREQSCNLPAVHADAKFLLIGAYEGMALSTVALGDDKAVVSVANIVIEPGGEPLYLVLISHQPMIWLFSGAITRVVQVVVTAPTSDENGVSRVGVVGLPGERVFVPEKLKCIAPFYDDRSREAHHSAITLKNLVGLDVDVQIGRYQINTLSLPSGKSNEMALYRNTIALPLNGPAKTVWRTLLRFKHGGLVKIEPAEVVSRSQARPYIVLPEEAGLAQLVDAGALEIGTTRRAFYVGSEVNDSKLAGASKEDLEKYFMITPKQYLVTKKITFPAGLEGIHSTEFILKPGVPWPDGSPGQSKIIRR